VSKKQKKQFIVVFILLVIFGVGYFAVDKFYDDEKAKEEESLAAVENNKEVVFELGGDIVEVSYKSQSIDVTLVKIDDAWRNIKEGSNAIDSSKLESSILGVFTKITCNNKIENPEDTSQYGFDEPLSQGTIVLDNGKTHSFVIGMQNEFDTSQYYLMINDDANVYVVDSALNDVFTTDIAELEVQTTEAQTSTEIAE